MNLEKQKENFKNHRATFKDLGNIKILDFKKPNSTEYRIRFLFEEDYCRLHIFGKRETGILDLYMLAFKLAKEQLKISKED